MRIVVKQAPLPPVIDKFPAFPNGARGHDFSNCKQLTTLMWQECVATSANNSPTTSKVETLLSGSFVLPWSRMKYRFLQFNEGLFDAGCEQSEVA